MKRLPLKLCPDCGLYHDISMEECSCGADLRKVPAKLTEMNIPAEKFGEIDEELPTFVQRCSACGTDNFTDDPAHKVTRCWNCHKPRIAAVAPVLFEDAQPEEEKPSAEDHILLGGHTAAQNQLEAEEAQEDDEDDAEAGGWANLMQRTRQNAAGIGAGAPNPFAAAASDDDDEDEDDEEDDDDDGAAASGWGSLLGGGKAAKPSRESTPVGPVRAPASGTSGQRVSAAPQRQRITLTATRGGSLSFSLTEGKDSLPYMLGRSANHGGFFAWDLQVGNNHCALDFRGGAWMVIDNNSANGTAVNGAFLDPNESRVLRSGDRLMVGHRPDSPEFAVKIEK